MLKGNKKLFVDKSKLSQMLALRYSGYALTSLAILYNCDISSIRFWCDRFHVKPKEVYTIERFLRQILPQGQQEIRRNVVFW